jgi:hypothetical protein
MTRTSAQFDSRLVVLEELEVHFFSGCIPQSVYGKATSYKDGALVANVTLNVHKNILDTFN